MFLPYTFHHIYWIIPCFSKTSFDQLCVQKALLPFSMLKTYVWYCNWNCIEIALRIKFVCTPLGLYKKAFENGFGFDLSISVQTQNCNI